MKSPSVHLIVCFIAFSIVMFIPAMASSIQMEPSSITVQTGSSASINLALDDAPSGLAGYDLVVRFSNPGVAEITDVTYPSWATLNNVTHKSAGSVRISGVDNSRQVEAGRINIPLASLKIKGISGGTSSIVIESVYMDADGGSIITPTLPAGTITVLGTSGSSSGGSGGGGGGYSSQATQTPIHTPTSTFTHTQTAVIQSPVPTTSITQTTPDATPKEMSAHSEPTANAGSSDSTKGVPWIWIVGGVMVIAAIVCGGYFALKRERKED